MIHGSSNGFGFELEHLWRCRTLSEGRESHTSYYMTHDSSVESLEEVVRGGYGNQNRRVLVPVEYLGRISNPHRLIDGDVLHGDMVRWADETVRLEREAYEQIVHGGAA